MKHEELQEALGDMLWSQIVEVGSIDEIRECGLYFDYKKGNKVYRVVLGYNDLGGWVEYHGKKSEFSLEKCLTASIQ
jgi:hypothetical protein